MAGGAPAASRSDSLAALAAQACAGDRRALARLISAIERGGADGADAALALHEHAAETTPYTVGLTGAPGAGKSTLTDALVATIRAREERVAIVAVDPSSPFSGGAILGDRVRLRDDHATDDDVYMRSLANRGHLGGLALAVPEVVRALGAARWPTVLVETVGVGQAEVEIAGQADTTVVVVNPGWGDEIQANKAGLLEVADVLVVNKADRDGARATMRDLRRMLDAAGGRDWRPPVVSTVATSGDGVAEMWDAIGAHREHLESGGELERRRAERLVGEVRERMTAAVAAEVRAVERTGEGQALLQRLRTGDAAPQATAEALLDLVRRVPADDGRR